MSWSRRRVLTAGSALAGVSAAGLLVGGARGQSVAGDAHRRIALLNLHTGERLDVAISPQLEDGFKALDTAPTANQ